MITVRDKDGKTLNVYKEDPRWVNGEVEHVTKGLVSVKDDKGNTFKVTVSDERYINGELKHITDGTVVVKDKTGECFRVSNTDSRYLSGEFVGTSLGLKFVNHWWNGKTHSEETKQKLRKSKGVGATNSQFGTCWITNGVENKKIKKEDIIPDGWIKGRK
jgi:hypothetical protein